MILACSTANNPRTSTSASFGESTSAERAGKGDRGAVASNSVEKQPTARKPGRYLIGKAYQVAGKWFEPKEDAEYDRTGTASWYGAKFHGRRTANGEVFDRTALTAAHPTLPLPSYVRVTNVQNERSVVVRVNDRGPFSRKRLIDVSEQTAELLDFKNRGMAQVRVEYVGRAEMEGSDNEVLLASYRGPQGGSQPQARVTLASVAPPRREGISAPGHVPPPPKIARRRPAPELAFGTTTPVSASPQVEEAVLLISTPASADARITTAFDTASATLQ